jgi:hypothetical protein
MPQRYRECIEYSEPRIVACGHTQEIIHITPSRKTSPQMAANMKDRLVLSMACSQDVGVADCDTFIEYVPELKSGSPAFAYQFGLPQISLFYVNGCMQYFEYLQRKKYSLGIASEYGFPQRLFRGEFPQAIPEDSYSHKRIMTGNYNRSETRRK